VLYLDSSAIVKLVIPEPETNALVETLRSDSETVSSVLARIEVLRAVHRARARKAVADRAESILSRVALVRLDHGIVTAASNLRPPASNPRRDPPRDRPFACLLPLRAHHIRRPAGVCGQGGRTDRPSSSVGGDSGFLAGTPVGRRAFSLQSELVSFSHGV
jgi:predicted nucleic acid-binding protein